MNKFSFKSHRPVLWYHAVNWKFVSRWYKVEWNTHRMEQPYKEILFHSPWMEQPYGSSEETL